MARWTVAPDSRLSRWVEYIAFSVDPIAVEPAPVRVVPDGRSDLLFSVPADFNGDGGDEAFDCFAEILGTKTAPLTVSSSRRVENIAVAFRPAAAKRFFELPAHLLTDRAHTVGEVWGREGRELSRSIGACATASGRKSLIENALLRRLQEIDARAGARTQSARAIVDQAVQTIERHAGRVSIKQLCREVECSERRLERIFREWVGVGPKRLARIVRFRASAEALQQGHSQLDVAHAFGYADQPHLLRDFRAFSGTTPGALHETSAASAASEP